ncbi:hypothetical protein EAS68_10580 [Legionella jordanis]|nr:hypothetical protein EAS68_10580 [Legionella jordanis]
MSFSPLATSLGFVPLPMTFFIFLLFAAISYLYLVEKIKKIDEAMVAKRNLKLNLYKHLHVHPLSVNFKLC